MSTIMEALVTLINVMPEKFHVPYFRAPTLGRRNRAARASGKAGVDTHIRRPRRG